MTVSVLGQRLPAAATYAAALGGALLLMALTVAAAFWQTSHTFDLNAQMRDATDRRSHYRLLLRAMQDAETGQRGFLLTHETPYLAPYDAGRVAVDAQLAAVDHAANSDAMRVEALHMRELVTIKLNELAQTITLERANRHAAAMTIVRGDIGKRAMDELRAAIEVAETREQATNDRLIAEVDQSGAQLRWIIGFAVVLLFGIGALMFFTVRNALGELRASRDEARAANARMQEEIVAREAAETKARQMQKMEAIGQITGGVAHDFNNMLAVIMSALQLARRRLERGENTAMPMIEAALDGARRAAVLTRRLLAFARRQPLQPAVLDVNRVLGDMSELLRRTLGETVDLETVTAGGLWRVSADRHELEQAVLNVCVNARDAMPGGGKLTIESANASLDDAYAAANIDVTAGQYVMVAVTDTGEGMPEEVRLKAFEPFFTTKDIGKGTGLGLSHVHGFLKQSGGHAAIYSEPGHGTTVKLYLPRTQLPETDAVAPIAAADEPPQGDPATIILVVEDDERVRLLSVTALRDLGYSVLHASSGDKALEVLTANPGIALLFTDVVMPGMSGRVLVDRARAQFPDLKVLYTTGYTQNAIVHNGVVDADARLLMKPFTLSDLASKVRAALDQA